MSDELEVQIYENSLLPIQFYNEFMIISLLQEFGLMVIVTWGTVSLILDDLHLWLTK